VLTIEEDEDDDEQAAHAIATAGNGAQRVSMHLGGPRSGQCLGSFKTPTTTAAAPQPATFQASSQTRALLEQSNRVLQMQGVAEEEEDSPLKPSGGEGGQQGYTAAGDAPAMQQNAGACHVPQLAALSAKARAAEVMQRQQHEWQQQEQARQQQLNGSSQQPVEGGGDVAGSQAWVGTEDASKVTIVCQYKVCACCVGVCGLGLDASDSHSHVF
jgi:hypothetical protein